MGLAIDTVDGRGLSNEARRELRPARTWFNELHSI